MFCFPVFIFSIPLKNNAARKQVRLRAAFNHSAKKRVTSAGEVGGRDEEEGAAGYDGSSHYGACPYHGHAGRPPQWQLRQPERPRQWRQRPRASLPCFHSCLSYMTAAGKGTVQTAGEARKISCTCSWFGKWFDGSWTIRSTSVKREQSSLFV